MLKTHKNFKSVYPDIRDIETLLNKHINVKRALEDQHRFHRFTTPHEKESLCVAEDYEIEVYEIDLEKLDRLYYIAQSEKYHVYDIHIVGRIDDDDWDKPLFVEIVIHFEFTHVHCCNVFDEYDSHGTIFISFDVHLFMKLIATLNGVHMDPIRQLLLDEDGIALLDNVEKYDENLDRCWVKIPRLDYLCHMAVYEHKVEHYRGILPIILKNSVDDFIESRNRFRDAMPDYQKQKLIEIHDYY